MLGCIPSHIGIQEIEVVDRQVQTSKILFANFKPYMSMKYFAKLMCVMSRSRLVFALYQSDHSLRKLGSFVTKLVHSKGFDQTGCIFKLI